VSWIHGGAEFLVRKTRPVRWGHEPGLHLRSKSDRGTSSLTESDRDARLRKDGSEKVTGTLMMAPGFQGRTLARAPEPDGEAERTGWSKTSPSSEAPVEHQRIAARGQRAIFSSQQRRAPGAQYGEARELLCWGTGVVRGRSQTLPVVRLNQTRQSHAANGLRLSRLRRMATVSRRGQRKDRREDGEGECEANTVPARMTTVVPRKLAVGCTHQMPQKPTCGTDGDLR
jgi:hypothetical protein